MFYPLGSVCLSDSERASALVGSWWLIGLRGLAAIGFAVAALALPRDTFFILVIAFAAACLVDGFANLALAVQCARRGTKFGLVLLQGVVAAAIGASIFVSPHVTAVTLVALVAAWSILSGLLLLDLGFLCRDGAGRVLLLTIGAASIGFGVFLLASPALSVLVLVWWLGANAMVVGLALLVLAFGLKQSHYAVAL